MKLLVVLFALAVVTGGRAVTTREAPTSEPKLRELVDKIFRLGLEVFFSLAGKFLNGIESSNTRAINEHQYKISEILREQERKLPPEMREVKEIVFNLSEALTEKTFRVIGQWNSRHYKEIRGAMDAFALYIDPVASKMLWCIEWLEQNVRPIVIEMYKPYERSLDQAMESLGRTFIENLQKDMESLQTSLEGGAKRFQLGMETLHKHLKPFWIPLLKEYKKYDPAIREWVESPLFPPPKED
nr:uncharacterized protein LOC132780615 isoform X2 [Anolis sagrei ordinatus]